MENAHYVRDMFEFYFKYASSDDPLRLRFRPVFQLLNKKELSLAEIEGLASRSPLIGAFPDSRLLSQLRDSRFVFDRSAEVNQLLSPFLPPVIWLEDVKVIFGSGNLHPRVRQVEETIRTFDPDFRIHQVPDSDEFRGISLVLNGSNRGKRHLLLGENHQVFTNIIQGFALDPAAGLLRGVELLLHKMTFFLQGEEMFLSSLAGGPSLDLG